MLHSPTASADLIDSRYAMLRLAVVLALMTISGCAMYVVAVVLPYIQSDFQVARGDASLPYTMLMLGGGLGGVLMGRLTDRFGIAVPVMIGSCGIGIGFIVSAYAPNIWVFIFAHGVLLGLLGTSAMFAPLIADTSLWFARWRGIAVAICASGNFLAGVVWPPIVQYFVDGYGWRQTYVGLGVGGGVVMLLLGLCLRKRPPLVAPVPAGEKVGLGTDRPFGLAPRTAQFLLCVAGVACCTAMAMPQVHIVAYCSDLGFGTVRGAQMLSLMFACGIISRLVFGMITDRIGGLRTLLLGSALQGLGLLLFLPFDSLWSLYLVSAMFGLFQGGIVPSYAIIIREHFAPNEVGGRVGGAIMATMLGMALGGWMSGVVFDLTGSYRAAFINGFAWDLLNFGIAYWLWRRVRNAKAHA